MIDALTAASLALNLVVLVHYRGGEFRGGWRVLAAVAALVTLSLLLAGTLQGLGD